MNLRNLVRPNIWSLAPYSSARSEFTGDASVFLDANENPFNNPYNRYPDPLQCKVKERIAENRGVAPENIFLGVGSDECIDLAYRIFCKPGKDNVVAIAPSYGMYKVCADINDVEYRKVELDENFNIDTKNLLARTDAYTKLIWVCTPNNPTGNAFNIDTITDLCRSFNGIVMVDEAYIDFSEKGTMLSRLADVPNVIILQTFSKAWGSASVRLGMAFACKDIINLYNKVKYPYNINKLAQEYAIKALDRSSEVADWVATLLANKQILVDELKALRCVHRVYHSDANFVLIKVADADGLYEYLRKNGIIVRNRNKIEKCIGCLRITVGTKQENESLINAIADYEQQ